MAAQLVANLLPDLLPRLMASPRLNDADSGVLGGITSVDTRRAATTLMKSPVP